MNGRLSYVKSVFNIGKGIAVSWQCDYGGWRFLSLVRSRS